ncbi:MAG TPA: DUF5667 domain-containing protein [Dehalococcoidia bacterium]|nr:DUF5667 domain-containing protein [Dehalococcoidia bacterium]
MSEFEALLDECLEALREGRRDVDACLHRYPEHAAALRPRLLAAAAAMRAYSVAPPEDFAAAARERFLIASGQRLSEAYDQAPEPTFFAAARVRFLMAAHRMTQRDGRTRAPRLVAFTERHFRTLASAAAVLVLFLSFSTYTIASANNALPGDWQYPVKLQTERVRLALAFGTGAKREVRLDIAEERAHEIEGLAKERRTITAGVLARLVDQTKPLVADAGANWDTADLARLQSVVAFEQAALQQARPQIPASAQQQLTEAVQVTMQGVTVSNQILTTRTDRPPAVVTPYIPLSALDITPTPTTTPTATATTTAPAGASATPVTPAAPAGSATPAASPSAVPTGEVIVNPTPEKVRGTVSWLRIAAGNVTTLVPSAKDGWYILGINGDQSVSSPSPTLVKLSNTNGTSLITLNTQNGDMYWFIAHGNKFDEIQMRIRQPNGQVLVTDPGYLRAVYGSDAEIPLFVLANIDVTAPAATATPAITPGTGQ